VSAGQQTPSGCLKIESQALAVIARSEATKQSSCAPAGALKESRSPRPMLRFLFARFRARWIASLRSQ
jgi:hypothetical protein